MKGTSPFSCSPCTREVKETLVIILHKKEICTFTFFTFCQQIQVVDLLRGGFFWGMEEFSEAESSGGRRACDISLWKPGFSSNDASVSAWRGRVPKENYPAISKSAAQTGAAGTVLVMGCDSSSVTSMCLRVTVHTSWLYVTGDNLNAQTLTCRSLTLTKVFCLF